MDMFTNLDGLQTLLFRVFMEVLLHMHDLLYHWPLEIKSVSSLCLLPRGQGKGSECQVSNHCLDFLVTSPQAETVRGPQPPVISLAHKTFITQEIPKMLASMCQEPGTKTTYCDKRLSYNPY